MDNLWTPPNLAADDAEGWVRAAMAHFGPKLTISCSFGGTGGMVLVDMAVKINPHVDVFVLDTDLLFPETYATIEKTEARYGIKIRRARALLTVEEQSRLYGDDLWFREPDKCCGIRKVDSMKRGVAGYGAWITAIRRDQSSTREATEVVSWDKKFGMWKVCPLAHWDEFRVLNYIYNNDVPVNPMLERGYTSIGCVHCTAKPTAEGGRSGRWAGSGKVECGLHAPDPMIAIAATPAPEAPAALTIHGGKP